MDSSFDIDGDYAYTLSDDGSMLYTYEYDSDTDTWNFTSGEFLGSADGTSESTPAYHDPTTVPLTDTVGAQVKADIQAGNYYGAVMLIISTYGFDTTNSSLSFSVSSSVFETTGNVGTGDQQVVHVPIKILQDFALGYLSYGELVRALGHEYQHVKQKSGPTPVTDHTEREFLAYIYTLTAADLPPMTSSEVKFYQAILTGYYNQLPAAKKAQYQSVYLAALTQ